MLRIRVTSDRLRLTDMSGAVRRSSPFRSYSCERGVGMMRAFSPTGVIAMNHRANALLDMIYLIIQFYKRSGSTMRYQEGMDNGQGG